MEINSGSEFFVNYACRYFMGEPENKPAGSRPDIVCHVSFPGSFSFRVDPKREQHNIILGQEMAAAGDGGPFYFDFRELRGVIKNEGPAVEATVRIRRNLFKYVSRLLFFRKYSPKEYYARLVIRDVIQNLLFVKLQEKKKVEIVSGASIVLDGNAYIFAGLPGGGKTTLVRAIKKADANAVVLAENFVLISDKMAFAFTEGIWPSVGQGFPIRGVYFIYQGSRMNIRKVSPAEGMSLIDAVNDYTRELPRYGFYAAIALLDDRIGNSIFSKKEVADVIGSVPCYRAEIDLWARDFCDYLINHS